jgi:hypothetical protein
MTQQKQKLELLWIGPENRSRPEPRLRIEFADDPQREDSPVRCHEAALAVCSEPRCRCLEIRIQWLGAPAKAPGRPVRDFWFNLDEKIIRLTPELAQEPDALRLAEILRTELTEADQQKLREWFFAAKLVCIQTTPIAEMDMTNLPDADDGKMISFIEVFPLGLALNFTWNQEAWAVDEQYCVKPGCNCQEPVLTFLKLRDAAGRKTTRIKNPPALRYDYQAQTFKPLAAGAAGSPALAGLLAALQREQATLNTQLKLRHRIMQALYTRHYLAPTGPRLPSRPAHAPAAGVPKPGRNAPCPCGSGRKYKHCCLNKRRS